MRLCVVGEAGDGEMPRLRQLYGGKRGRKGEVWHLCANETCHHRIEVQASEEEADE